MPVLVPDDEFCKIAIEYDLDPKKINERLKVEYPDLVVHRPSRVSNRIESCRRKGLLPLDSGNSVSKGEVLKGTSTLYDANGHVKQQWVKTDVRKSNFIDEFREALTDITKDIEPLPEIQGPIGPQMEDLATLYISNDVHFGLLTWAPETGVDWNTNRTVDTMKAAYDYLFEVSPPSKVGIVCDLGDLTEADDFTNLTPHGKNPLDTDSRYPKVLRAAHQALAYAIRKALEKHEIVYFYNIAGNHDVSSGHAVREVLYALFENNDRVIICDSPNPIKYHQHGKTLLGFAHGDGLKMNRAGETMAIDNQSTFSTTEHRFFHFGHTHVDAVKDGAICRCESHRNIAPLNHWAHHKGFRRGVGTMKSITYSTDLGEISRQTYNVILDS